MKKITFLFKGIVMLSSTFFANSCGKIEKYLPALGNNKTSCRITQVQQLYPGSPSDDPRTGIFYYGSKGNLDSVIFDRSSGSAGAQYFYFKYNQAGRLIEYRADYSREANDFYFIHKYVYQGNKIVTDSAWIREAGTVSTVRFPEYDNQGRVIRETGTWLTADGEPVNEPLDPIDYTYDGNGNLLAAGNPSYDDKISYLRTNENLMFVERNYSRNNIAGATAYNS